MKRREFIQTPALTLLIPASGSFEQLFAAETGEQDTTRPQLARGEVEQRLHSDFITYVPGIEYFFIGNGDIQGAVQYSPKDRRCSLFGFTLMNPERFCRKWSTYLYHPERGLTNSRLGVTVDDSGAGPDNTSGMFHGVKGYSVTQETFSSVRWKYPDGVPVVSLEWKAGPCTVEEEFFVPHEGAVLFRRVTIRNTSARDVRASVNQSLYPNFGLFDTIYTDEQEKAAHAKGLAQIRLAIIDRPSTVAGRYDVRADLGTIPASGQRQALYMYSLNGGEELLGKKSFEVLWQETVGYWKTKSSFRSGDETLDHLFNVSRTCLRSIVARSGKMDGGTWMYNMEWLFDHLLAMEGMLRAGNVELARLMLENNIQRNVGPDGRAIESGRWFGYDYTELNQNGALLYGAWAYYCWTGDIATIRKHWEKIKLCGDFPFNSHFLDPATGMVHNKREFWERSDTHGVLNGYELGYQFWVGYGWQRGAELAAVLGDTVTADRWSAGARKIKKSALEDPKFRLIENDHLIKRRTVDGVWQQYFIPPDRNRVPAGSPIALNEKPDAEPDTIVVYPLIHRWIDPQSALASNTLAWVDRLWNQDWSTGGYTRYNIRSDENPSTPWPIASMLVARAYAEAGNEEKAWRVLTWLRGLHGGLSGSWFEQYTQSITPPLPPVGIVGWIWYELIAFCVSHVAGFRPEARTIIIRPWLPSTLHEVHTRQTVRGGTVDLTVKRAVGKKNARVETEEVSIKDGQIEIPYPAPGTVVKVEFDL